MQIQAVYNDDNSLKDIEISLETKKLFLLGNTGKNRELSILNKYETRDKVHVLPIFIGLGFGYAIEKFLEESDKNIPVCIIDKENFCEIDAYNQQIQNIINNPRVYLVSDSNKKEILKKVTHWQNKHNDLPLLPLVNTQYLRFDSSHYKDIHEKLEASYSFDFWGKVRKKRFQNEQPKLLLITSKYFLMGEIVTACQLLGYEHRLLVIEDEKLLQEEFVTRLLNEVVEFQPDAVFTLNHLGVDREGVLTDLLARLELPLAAWFVDNPHLVLSSYPRLTCEWLTIFTYDEDNIPSLNQAGYDSVHYLPLGTDIERFHPRNAQLPYPKQWDSDVSFVGNSMRTKVASALKRADVPRELILHYKEIGAFFANSNHHSVYDCIAEHFSHCLPYYESLGTIEKKLAFETVITWEATRQYRFECFSEVFPFKPLVVGDESWIRALDLRKVQYNFLPPLSYYSELPNFYTHSKINFNATSKQMKNAVNQRIFDVTATNSFVLTDWRSQMDNLLESGKEIISYKDKDEIFDLTKYYLKNESERKKITEKGRQRVLAEHKWEDRVQTIVNIMKKRYA